MQQEYTTIYSPAEDEFVERKSRFIGHIAPVQTEEEAQAFIAQIRQQHRDATHNTYAYILRSGIKRYSDDGEPQGTAGVPVLEVLQREGLVDVAAVVTRYFGGVLLGAGGLVRAYSHAAKLAVDAAERMVMSECAELSAMFSYDQYGRIERLLAKYGARTLGSDYAADVTLRVLMKANRVEAFQRDLAELTAGRGTACVEDRRYDCMP